VLAQTTQFDLGIGYSGSTSPATRTSTERRSRRRRRPARLPERHPHGARRGLFDRLTLDAAGIGASPDALPHPGQSRRRVQPAHQYFRPTSSRRCRATQPVRVERRHPRPAHLRRRRDAFDLDLELLPAPRSRPLVGLSAAALLGPRQHHLPLRSGRSSRSATISTRRPWSTGWALRSGRRLAGHRAAGCGTSTRATTTSS